MHKTYFCDFSFFGGSSVYNFLLFCRPSDERDSQQGPETVIAPLTTASVFTIQANTTSLPLP